MRLHNSLCSALQDLIQSCANNPELFDIYRLNQIYRSGGGGGGGGGSSNGREGIDTEIPNPRCEETKGKLKKDCEKEKDQMKKSYEDLIKKIIDKRDKLNENETEAAVITSQEVTFDHYCEEVQGKLKKDCEKEKDQMKKSYEDLIKKIINKHNKTNEDKIETAVTTSQEVSFEDLIKKIIDKHSKIDNEDKITTVIASQEVILDHCLSENCGHYAYYYGVDSQVGRQGFSTSDLLKALLPEMYSNPKIAKYLEKGAQTLYRAENYKFVFTEPLGRAWGSYSNMECNKCKDEPNEIACQNDDTKSFCYPKNYYRNKEYRENFFDKNSCPNLIKESGAIITKARLFSPLILIDDSGKMVDKEGNNTQVHYSSLKPHLKANGYMKDCAGNRVCKELAEIMKKVAWNGDKEIILKVVYDNAQNASPYYYDNNNNDPKMFNAPLQDALLDNSSPDGLRTSHMLYSPALDPGEQVLIELKSLGIVDMNTGNIRGTETHFEICRKKLVEEVNKGNVAFLNDKLIADCLEDQSCEECVKAVNFAIDESAKQYINEILKTWNLDSNTYGNAII